MADPKKKKKSSKEWTPLSYEQYKEKQAADEKAYADFIAKEQKKASQNENWKNWWNDFGTTALTNAGMLRQPTQKEIAQGRGNWGDRADLTLKATPGIMSKAMLMKAAADPKIMLNPDVQYWGAMFSPGIVGGMIRPTIHNAIQRKLQDTPSRKLIGTSIPKEYFPEQSMGNQTPYWKQGMAKSDSIPEYSLGGWIKDNKQGVIGGVKTALGVGAMFIPGAQAIGAPLIASGIGDIAGEVSGDMQAKQDLEEQHSAVGELTGNNLAMQTFKSGGKVKKMANGGLVEWQGGEPLMTPGGKIVRTPKSMPSHAQGGVKGFLPEGTGFLGDKINPKTGNKYMEDGDKLGKIQDKSIKTLQVSGNKYARNAAILNKRNAEMNYMTMMVEQDEQGGKKMQHGGYHAPGDPERVSPTYGGYILPGATADTSTYRGLSMNDPRRLNPTYGYGGNSVWPAEEGYDLIDQLTPPGGTMQRIWSPNYGYTTPAEAMTGLRNQMWLNDNYNTIEPMIDHPQPMSLAQQGIFDERPKEPANININRGVFADGVNGQAPNPKNPLPLQKQRELAMNALNRAMWMYDYGSQRPQGNSGSGTITQPQRSAKSMRGVTSTSTPGKYSKADALKGISSGVPTVDSLLGPSPTLPTNFASDVGVINNNGSNLSFGQKAGAFLGENGTTIASLAPVAFDAISAMFPTEREKLPADYGKANSLLANRRFDVNPLLRNNRNAAAIARYNSKALGGGRGESSRAVSTAARMAADQDAWALKQRMDNQYKAEQAQGLFGTGAARREVDIANVANEAARRNMFRSSLTNFSNYMQNRELMNNMADRDVTRAQILARAFPYYNDWFQGVNL